MSATGHPKHVRLWCHACQAYVDYEGWVYESRSDAPVHVTPDMLRVHREAAHPDTGTVPRG